jgi:hypothetical protein
MKKSKIPKGSKIPYDLIFLGSSLPTLGPRSTEFVVAPKKDHTPE